MEEEGTVSSRAEHAHIILPALPTPLRPILHATN